MRITNPDNIVSPGASETGLVATGGGDDFLSRINRTITNFKELMAVFQQFKGIVPGPQPDQGTKQPQAQSGGAQFVQMLIAAGKGDTPIGELIKEISPYTIKQLLAMVKNVRPE